MNRRNMIKKISILFMILAVFTMFSMAQVMGTGKTPAEILRGGSFNGSSSPTGSSAIIDIISAVLEIVKIVGAAVAVVILMVIAGKYIMASAGDRADIKKYAVNYVIGAIILFGTTGILGIVQNFVNTSIK